MARSPCDVLALCGISVRFQTLFHTQRQVAHALLTRPPLTYFGASSSIRPFDLNVLCTPPAFILSQDQTLEIIVLKHRLLCDPILLSSLALSFFYFCLSSILICKNFRDPFQAFLALYFSLVVQFSRIICHRFCGDLSIIPLSFRFVNTFCKSFFNFFQSFFKVVCGGRPSCGRLAYYNTLHKICQGFL